jgi:hypothetical protein
LAKPAKLERYLILFNNKRQAHHQKTGSKTGSHHQNWQGIVKNLKNIGRREPGRHVVA